MSLTVVRRFWPLALGLSVLAGLLLWGQGEDLERLWTQLVLEIQVIQRDLHRQLASALRAVKAEGPMAAWALVGLSFFYGVFHAAGPGHGKVVVSTYLLTQESQLKRGLWLSLIAALCQGLTAIVLVTATVKLLGLTMRQAQGTVRDLESLSYALVVLVGLLLVFTRGRRLMSLRGTYHHHDHDEEAESCNYCDHSHGPSREDLDQPLSLRGLLGMIASIGIRPCSGAILVLLVANSLHLQWVGWIAVLAMSLGTALTVSILASLSVYARKMAISFTALLPGQRSRLSVAVDGVGLLGGLVIVLAGVLLLQASVSQPAHPLL